MGRLSATADGQDAVVTSTGNIAKGTVPGIVPELVTKDTLEEVSKALDGAKDAYDGTADGMASLVYARAASRDLAYTMMGRRAVLTSGLSRSANYARWRGFALSKLQK